LHYFRIICICILSFFHFPFSAVAAVAASRSQFEVCKFVSLFVVRLFVVVRRSSSFVIVVVVVVVVLAFVRSSLHDSDASRVVSGVSLLPARVLMPYQPQLSLFCF